MNLNDPQNSSIHHRYFLIYLDCAGCGLGRDECSRTVVCSAACGYVTSPNFPVKNGRQSARCSWTISGTFGHFIVWQFFFIEIDGGGHTCDNGYAALYDGNTDSSTLISKFCFICYCFNSKNSDIIYESGGEI